MKNPHKPFYNVTDYFMRIKSAGRGTAHVHWFAYIKDVPEYEKVDKKLAKVYESIISCSTDVRPDYKSI